MGKTGTLGPLAAVPHRHMNAARCTTRRAAFAVPSDGDGAHARKADAVTKDQERIPRAAGSGHFPPERGVAKCLSCKDGRVAEWFKAPVLKF